MDITVSDLYRYLGSSYAQHSKADEEHKVREEQLTRALMEALEGNKQISARLSALEAQVAEEDNGEHIDGYVDSPKLAK